jgi:hypothetical protein
MLFIALPPTGCGRFMRERLEGQVTGDRSPEELGAGKAKSRKGWLQERLVRRAGHQGDSWRLTINELLPQRRYPGELKLIVSVVWVDAARPLMV